MTVFTHSRTESISKPVAHELKKESPLSHRGLSVHNVFITEKVHSKGNYLNRSFSLMLVK